LKSFPVAETLSDSAHRVLPVKPLQHLTTSGTGLWPKSVLTKGELKKSCEKNDKFVFFMDSWHGGKPHKLFVEN